ncbi:STAS domain-containing protein [Methylogaea oryzae]|uniref:Anti-anti-sigma regulatory factor n=1 Tax=Methylogaea oryzae TaxID=1295382 RepID=A0A8D4VQW8_9GAMM|nr:STAS domain-containing protein [Methylogaea oryzae]BBL70977.1 anti-anti-sigma regulatory factor [Methylogaea oryzae]
MGFIGRISKFESADKNTLFVRVHSRFDFRLQREFRAACHVRRYRRYVIDLGGIDCIDSAALGMLMLLYRHAGEDRRAIALIQCGSEVLEILRIARFGQFFEIAGLDAPGERSEDRSLCFAV